MLQVQIQDAFKAEADTVIQRLKDQLAPRRIAYADMSRNDPPTIQARRHHSDRRKGRARHHGRRLPAIVNDNYSGIWNLTPVNPTDYRLTMKTTEALKLRADTLSQSMNTIEKKINALGLAESSVQQRGGSTTESELLVQLPGVDDPARIKQILKTAAILELYEVIGGPFASREEAHGEARRRAAARTARFWAARRAAVLRRSFTFYRGRRW